MAGTMLSDGGTMESNNSLPSQSIVSSEGKTLGINQVHSLKLNFLKIHFLIPGIAFWPKVCFVFPPQLLFFYHPFQFSEQLQPLYHSIEIRMPSAVKGPLSTEHVEANNGLKGKRLLRALSRLYLKEWILKGPSRLYSWLSIPNILIHKSIQGKTEALFKKNICSLSGAFS